MRYLLSLSVDSRASSDMAGRSVWACGKAHVADMMVARIVHTKKVIWNENECIRGDIPGRICKLHTNGAIGRGIGVFIPLLICEIGKNCIFYLVMVCNRILI